MSTEPKYAGRIRPEPKQGDAVKVHAEYHIVRAIGFAKGWLDRTLWADPDYGRARHDHLLTLIAEGQLARLWVGIRDGENPQAIADWMGLFEDPDVWLEWLMNQAESFGVGWDDVLPYGGDAATKADQ